METVIRTGAARAVWLPFFQKGQKKRMSKFLVIAEKPSVAQSYAKKPVSL